MFGMDRKKENCVSKRDPILGHSGSLDTHVCKSFCNERQVGCKLGMVDFKLVYEFSNTFCESLVRGRCLRRQSCSSEDQLNFVDEQSYFRSRLLIDLWSFS